MNAIQDCLAWLDISPPRYWFLAWTAFAVVAGLALTAPAERRPVCWGHSVLFAFAVFAALAAFRWPAWLAPGELNPDESQLIAGALTLAKYPVYWEFVDGTTHGPLCELPIVAASWLGAPFDYTTVRILAALMQAGALLGVWGTLRQLTTERNARLAVLPGLAFWAFVSWHDFAHYSTELPGILLLSVATWSLTAALRATPGRRRHWLLYLGGLALGAVPFTKLQLIPPAAAVATFAAGLLWFVDRPTLRSWWRSLISLVLGGVTTSILVSGYLLAHGLVGEFWHACVLSNLAYTGMGHHPRLEMPSWFFHFATTSFAFAWFLVGTLGFALLYARAAPTRPPALRLGALVSWINLGVAYLAVLSPSREVAHYLHILVVPATLLAGFILAGALEEAPAPADRGHRPWSGPILAFFLIAVGPQVFDRAFTYHEFINPIPTHRRPYSALGQYLRQHAQPNDTLAMWGWEPALYVETGLPQGTRESHTSFQLTTWPLQQYYIDRFLADLKQRRPAWFVDAVGPNAFVYENRDAFAHEKFAAVADHIKQHYEFVAEYDNKRLFRLKRDPTE